MSNDQFSSKASESAPADLPPAGSTSASPAPSKPPLADESLKDRLSKLESRVQELELALASHAAPTLGKLHDNHGILAGWFENVKGRFINNIGKKPIGEPPAE